MKINFKNFFQGRQKITKPQAKKLMQLEKEGRLRDIDSTFTHMEVYTPHSGAAEAFESLESRRPVYIASDKSHFASVQQIKDPGDLDFIETGAPLTEKEEKNLDIRFSRDKKAITNASMEHLTELEAAGRFREKDESFHHTEVYNKNSGAGENAEKLRKHKAVYVANQSEYSYHSTYAPTQEVHNLEDFLLIPEAKAEIDPGNINNWNIAGTVSPYSLPLLPGTSIPFAGAIPNTINIPPLPSPGVPSLPGSCMTFAGGVPNIINIPPLPAPGVPSLPGSCMTFAGGVPNSISL